MKYIIFYVFMGVLLCCFSSCYKDLGNYDYQEINRVFFGDIDTVQGYTAYYNDTLRIMPDLKMTQDASPDDEHYAYEWSLRLNNTRDSVLSNERNLNTWIGLNPGSYVLQYRVTDKTTNVAFHIRTNLLVSTEVYEGYLVLNETDGQPRLDMLSYLTKEDRFVQYPDVLSHMGSALKLTGTPYQVLCMNYTRSNITPAYYGIILLTSTGTNRVHPETFAWDETYNIRYLMVGDVPQDFAAEQITGAYWNTNSSPALYMYNNQNIYSYSVNAGYAFKYTPLNSYGITGSPFKAAPFVATDGSLAVMYNMDDRKFAQATSYSSTTVVDMPEALNYPVGYDLVHMESNFYPEGGQVKYVYAILKDPNTSSFSFLRFVLGGAPDYFEKIQVPDFAQAEHFAVSPDLHYLFYNMGGKIYEYDLFLETSKLMVDKGNAAISYLAFQHMFDRYGKANYVDWSKMLMVGSYNPAAPANSGVLEQYTVPPVNGALQLAHRWTGFDKIVSVAYRNR